jgi:spore germination protein KA
MDYGNNINKSKSKSKKEVDLDILVNEILKTMSIEKVETEKDIIEKISKNELLIFVEGEEGALAIDIIDYPARMPNEPPTSAVMKGPREGFVEDIRKNVAMLRRRFVGDKLTIKQMKIGKYSQTEVDLVYISEIADANVIKKVKKKLEAINIDGIIDSYYLVSFLQEKKGSMFKQVGNSEKPDIIAAKILEGRIAIIVNNSPIVLTLPFIFLEDLQNSNDYYSLSYYSSYIRIIRLLGIFIAVVVPGLYISLRLYHYNVMPINFLMTIGNSSETIPFTPFVEIMFILILFEILYEVSLRLHRYLD